MEVRSSSVPFVVVRSELTPPRNRDDVATESRSYGERIGHRDTEPRRSSLRRIATESRSHGDRSDEDCHRATEAQRVPRRSGHCVTEATEK
jgi:hypothetical protein